MAAPPLPPSNSQRKWILKNRVVRNVVPVRAYISPYNTNLPRSTPLCPDLSIASYLTVKQRQEQDLVPDPDALRLA